MGWEEIARANLPAKTISQHWDGSATQVTVEKGLKVIMSPADKTYLDMKYQDDSPLGLVWAGLTSVEDAYNWDSLSEIKENNILGIEVPLWSETLTSIDDIEFMAFPRLAGHAEIAWSTKEGRSWEEYRRRLAHHGSLYKYLRVNFFRSPEIDWKE